MNLGRPSSRSNATPLTSKFIGIYSKLFQGLSPKQIVSQQDPERFFSDLLDLKVDRTYLEGELNRITKDICLGRFKPFLSTLFQACLKHARSAAYEDIRKTHAIETLSILVSRVLAKNLTGWEVMEVMAGSVAQSDSVFSEFTKMIDVIMGDAEAPPSIRHQVLQLGLTYMCGIAQLSTGAYFLRRDFFPSIVSLVKSVEMEQYTFEAILFLAILANYHKSNAAKLNPYLKRIRETTDREFMVKLCWASNFALATSIKSYQLISDDSITPSLTSSLGSVITRLRPDRALALTPLGAPQDKFKDQPIEASVVLLPVYEFLKPNPLFSSVMMEELSSSASADSTQMTPLPFTIISFASYLCTHASSTATPRSIAYASLSLNILLAFVEDNAAMDILCQKHVSAIRLCRQRLPALPPPRLAQSPICSILDCCVLWLRHNLQRRLEVYSYTNCIWICYRVVWFLQDRRIRLDYDWTELWNAVIGLLNFVSTKLETLHTTGGIELLASETIRLLELSLYTSESYLPSPGALHELIYELVRSSPILKKQYGLLESLALPNPSNIRPSFGNDPIADTLGHVLKVVDFYEGKITQIGARMGNPKDVMKVVADDIEANGLHGAQDMRGTTPQTRSEDVLDFARFACADVLALMP
ncbi:hypothetical protein B0H34DRAFT_646029 [Crassisporium funariophilum]|nr:hypothetical protein B0H34DRAFT_646029 [Crassisporium funariophilum]